MLLAVSQYYRNGLFAGGEFAAVMAAGLVALLGIIDDFKQLNISWRISAQFLASIGVIYFLGDVPAIDFGFMQTAKIFMGDVGNSFSGFSLGVMALLSMYHGSMTVWTWVLLLGVFVVDATLTLAIRFKNKKRWYEGHATHAYQNAARHYKKSC